MNLLLPLQHYTSTGCIVTARSLPNFVFLIMAWIYLSLEFKPSDFIVQISTGLAPSKIVLKPIEKDTDSLLVLDSLTENSSWQRNSTPIGRWLKMSGFVHIQETKSALDSK